MWREERESGFFELGPDRHDPLGAAQRVVSATTRFDIKINDSTDNIADHDSRYSHSHHVAHT